MTYKLTRSRLDKFGKIGCCGEAASAETVVSSRKILDLTESSGLKAPLIGLGSGGEVGMSWDGLDGAMVALECHDLGNYVAVAISASGSVLAAGEYPTSELPEWLPNILVG